MLSFAPRTTYRRFCPRVPVEELCTEHGEDESRHALVIDLSEEGLRVQRPLAPFFDWSRTLNLEFEIPGVDELVWAHGEVRFDERWRLLPNGNGGLSGVVRTSGIQLISASERHKRLLREYVRDTWEAMQSLREERPAPGCDWSARASCYRRG